ncbi:Uncharacterized protein PCOAH_00026060 [Plasmodium coatneyi]|uniref:RRM domain-containing protein n=1 Tax=Plasmodium coatneyi TaxID=208452 RepID=A0A1B1DZF1_9APIC|nr:Uncharacterized protein PCOAH_00026060 [Plasmodium coatneyi]ANQ08166.1 Uncharacterized protein PCOAH_00026060 [Plasmodium coatneyi]
MEQNGCSLLIKNLSFDTSPEKIRRIFQSFGKVRDVYLPLDHYTRRPRGFGFVEYFEPQYAKEALTNLNHSKIDGNEVKIIIAQNRRKSPETMKRYQQSARKGSRWSYKGHPPYRSNSRSKIIHRRRDTSSEEEEEGRGKCYQSKSRIMHKMSKKGKRLKGKKVARKYYRPRKKYSESASTYSASSSYRSSYSRGSNRRSNRRRRPRRRSRSQSWNRGAVRSTSRTTSYSTSYSASSYESDKGRRRTTKRKNPTRRQRKGEKEATSEGMKRQSSETFSRSASLSNSEGADRDGDPVARDPEKGIERRSGKDPSKDTDKHTCKDMGGRICENFPSPNGMSQEANKVSQNCSSKSRSYSTEQENQPGEQTHHDDGESLKRDDRVETIKAKKRTKSNNNSSEDTTTCRDPDGESNSKEESPQLSYQGSPTDGQNKQPYFLDHLEEKREKKEKRTKKNAKSVSTSSSSNVNCEGVTHEEASDKTYAERVLPPAKKLHRKGNSNNGSSSNKRSGSSQGTEEESSSSRFGTKRKRTCLSTTASNTNSTQMMNHLQSGEAENGNTVDTKNKSSSSAIEKENKFHLKEDLELCYLSGCDNAKAGDNFNSGEDCIGGNANSSSSTSSTYRGRRKKHKQRHLHEGKRKEIINKSFSTDSSTMGEKKSVRRRSKGGKSGKTENAHRIMMKNGRRNRGRIILSKSGSRGGSSGGGKITLGKSNTPCSSSDGDRGSPVGGEKKRGNTHPESVASYKSRTTCDDENERSGGKKGVAKRKRSISRSGSDEGRDEECDGCGTRRSKRVRMSEEAEESPREKRRRQGKKTRTCSNSIDKRKRTKREKLQRESVKKKSKRSKSKKEKFTKVKSKKTKFKKTKSPKKSYDSSTYSQSRRSRSSSGSSFESSSSHGGSSKMEKNMKHFSAKGSKGKVHKRDVRRRRARRIDSNTSDDSSSVSCNDHPVVRSKR